MTSASALAAWAYNNAERVAWLKDQRDLLVAAQFGGGAAAKSLINAGGNGSTAGFQIDLPGPEKLEIISDALETLGEIPSAIAPVHLTYADFSGLQR